MIILAVDPASEVTGYAVISGHARAGLIDAGLVTAGKRPPGGDSLFGERITSEATLAPWRRIFAIAAEVVGIALEVQPAEIVVEVPSGKAGTGSRRGAKSSLTTYGAAAGAVLMALHYARSRAGGQARVYPVTEREWIRSSKAARQEAATVLYGPRYDPARDPGGDVADAIGLGLWWLEAARLDWQARIFKRDD